MTSRTRLVTVVGAAVLAAAGLSAGLAAAMTSIRDNSRPAQSSRAYYQHMMGRYGGDSVMGGSNDLSDVIGKLFADAPGPRVSPADAQRLGHQTPAGATVDKPANRITFTARDVSLVVLASPSMPAESFRIAGLANPTIVMPAGAKVSIELINADEDMAHGLVVTRAGAASSFMPMMTSAPAFRDAAIWFLGDPTSAGMHTATITFTATTPGAYDYLCALPGHAQKGMAGRLLVS